MTNSEFKKIINNIPEQIVLDRAAQILEYKFLKGKSITSSSEAVEFIRHKIGGYAKEVFFVSFLDNSHKIIESKIVSTGSINSASVYPREIIKDSLELNCSALIIAHNHPSGSMTPSLGDKEITKSIKDCSELFRIKLLDHIIIGESYYSFNEHGLII